MCRDPRSSSCPLRTRPWGSLPRTPGTRADGPRCGRRGGSRPGRAGSRSGSPTMRARRRARAAGPSAGEWHGAPGPRTAAPRPRHPASHRRRARTSARSRAWPCSCRVGREASRLFLRAARAGPMPAKSSTGRRSCRQGGVLRQLLRAPAIISLMARVLVVDDEPAVRRALERALRLDSYEVALAADGEEALDALATISRRRRDPRRRDAAARRARGLPADAPSRRSDADPDAHRSRRDRRPRQGPRRRRR